MSNQAKTAAVTVEVTEEEYAADLARGLAEDEVLHPGRHTFRRGAFLARHGLTPEDRTTTPAKVYVSLALDQDVLDFVQERMEGELAEQINTMLREMMNREANRPHPHTTPQTETLVNDPQFIDAVAQRVAAYMAESA